MPPKCSICHHAQRAEIDKAIVAGAPTRSIEKQFGVSDTAVFRHKTNHLVEQLASVQAKQAADLETDGADLIADLNRLHAETMEVLDRAKAESDHKLTLAAVAEARKNLELMGKLQARMVETQTNVQVNVNQSRDEGRNSDYDFNLLDLNELNQLTSLLEKCYIGDQAKYPWIANTKTTGGNSHVEARSS